MPEHKGYQTDGLGVASWQTINEKMKNEAKTRLELMLNAPPPVTTPAAKPLNQSPSATPKAKKEDSAFLTACIDALHRMEKRAKTNPISAKAA